ncbi:MAG: site-specific integrase [Clostridia bacterium]|nr:site-specific integrase [Clostridia bacterium]
MVRKRSDGTWEGRIVVGHRMDGLPIYKSVFAKTQKALMPKLEQLKRDYAGAELTEDCRMPLGDWLDLWLSEYSPNLRPSTIQNYQNHIRTVNPFLGELQIDRVTRVDVQKMYNALRERLSVSTVRAVHMMLHEAMSAAVRRHLIVANPTEGVKLPKKGYAPIQILNNEQLDRFMAAIREEPDWHDLFYVEITTGLRRGELCGLRWEDFDENSGKLTVRRSINYEKKALQIGKPKTDAGKRTILLPASTAELLRARHKTSPSEWIFPSFYDPALPMKPQSAYNALKRILKKAGLPNLKFHSLRHVFGTQAISAGVDAKTLSTILGHTDASFTLDCYTHVSTDMQRNAAALIGGIAEDILGKDLMPWQNAKPGTEA